MVITLYVRACVGGERYRVGADTGNPPPIT